MQQAGGPHVIAAALNHSQAGLFGVKAIYPRERQEEAKREALELWSQRLRSIVNRLMKNLAQFDLAVDGGAA